MPVIQQVQTPKEFWEAIVVPDYEAFMAKKDDLRLAFHCAVALFHLADWVYVTHQVTINAAFTYSNRATVVGPVTNEGEFATSLAQAHPDFELIRRIANTAKHLRLRTPSTHSNAPSHAANTAVTSTGWNQGGWNQGPWNGSPRVTLANHPGQRDIEFDALAKSVFTMWERLNAQHGWW